MLEYSAAGQTSTGEYAVRRYGKYVFIDWAPATAFSFAAWESKSMMILESKYLPPRSLNFTLPLQTNGSPAIYGMIDTNYGLKFRNQSGNTYSSVTIMTGGFCYRVL